MEFRNEAFVFLLTVCFSTDGRLMHQVVLLAARVVTLAPFYGIASSSQFPMSESLTPILIGVVVITFVSVSVVLIKPRFYCLYAGEADSCAQNGYQAVRSGASQSTTSSPLLAPGEALLKRVIAANSVSVSFVYTFFCVRYTLISEALKPGGVAGVNTRCFR